MPPNARIYLDTNIFIFALEGEDAELRMVLAELFSIAPQKNEIRFVTSLITVSEGLVRPYRLAHADLIDQYERTLLDSPWLQNIPVDFRILQTAAILRAQNLGLKLPDAIHLATALLLGCSVFLTADLGIKEGCGRHPKFAGETLAIDHMKVVRPSIRSIREIISSLSP
ncbi:type II toxin-antitoxin system VapC family toxin [Rhizobium sp. C4]|uniref:type II toxin-antitoxin system VapC family toxin n=1 Tax=Rhizobium sp. C4 TaxID=1349800 RepID=UPI001E4AA376|nr:type II toxin-antitoxin system VapC family toxin [Rhizobium sp. C4]MCD2172657.1 type II toxin-antitoxin system VapC family toxin [Rhizobium sp. C4]